MESKEENIMRKNEYIEEEVSFRELAARIGIDDLDTPDVYDILDEGYEILSFDHETKKEIWKPLKSFVVKNNVSEHYQVNTLHGTKDHRIFVDGEYVRLEDYIGAELVTKNMQVVDCEVKDTHNYIAEGQINHNTTTPGGMAIPYAASVRVRISSTGQQHVLDKDKNVIGIKVKAKTIKNRVARPFRSCEFQIIFGVGVIEHEEVFDLFRAHCAELNKNDKEVLGVKFENTWLNVEGLQAWKTFSVTDIETGEVLITEKVYKSDFGNVLYNPAYEKYMDALFASALVVKREVKDHLTFAGVDSDSIEEAEAIKGS